MKIVKVFLFFGLICLSMSSCVQEVEGPPESVSGYAPTYLAKTDADTVSFEDPQPTVRPGKIVLLDSLLFQVEQYQGIHIIDLSDPDNAVKIGFYKIFGCSQLTIQGHYMYTNSGRNFIVIDMLNLMNPKVTDFRKDYLAVFSFPPPPANSYFECPDASKGIIIGWESKLLNKPTCRY